MKRLLSRATPAVERVFSDQHRFVQPEALNVAPHLVGAALASPKRRAFALGVDLLLVALLAGVGGLWLVVGLLLVVLQLRIRREQAGVEPAVTPTRTRRRAWVGWAVAAVLLFLAASEAQDRWDTWAHPGRAAQVASDGADADRAEALAEVTRALKEAQVDVPALATVTQQVEAMAQAASSAASAAVKAAASSAAASAPSMPPAPTAELNPDKRRIAELEAQLKDARRHKPLSWRQQWERLWDDVASSLGWGIVYFSLLPAWWGGQTVGKKLFGLRVVELTGKPMTVLRCLKRYGGYAAGMATGGLGFAQVLWDVNRQALQDKAAHTVVLDLRVAGLTPSMVVADDAQQP